MRIGEFIIRCFHARTCAHVLHLGTRSSAVHKALNDFYDEIVDLADSLAEAASGFELIKFPEVAYEPTDAISMLESLLESADAYIDACEEGHLINIAEEIKALIASTLYKLRFLK